MKYPHIHPVSFLLNQQWNSSVLPRWGGGGHMTCVYSFPMLLKRLFLGVANDFFWQFRCCRSPCIKLPFDFPPDSNLFNYARFHTFGINKTVNQTFPYFTAKNNICIIPLLDSCIIATSFMFQFLYPVSLSYCALSRCSVNTNANGASSVESIDKHWDEPIGAHGVA